MAKWFPPLPIKYKTISDAGITVDFWIIKVHTSNWSSNGWGSLNSWDHRIAGIIEELGIIEFLWIFHLKWSSWKNPAIILGTSREHLENIKRTSIEYLEKIQKHLWSSENICEHLRTSEHILNTSENLYRISVINWGHPEKKCPHRGWLSIKVTTQLKTSKNSWEHWQTSKIIWYHPENNWGPIIDNLVQLEKDFNSHAEMWYRVGKVIADQTNA